MASPMKSMTDAPRDTQRGEPRASSIASADATAELQTLTGSQIIWDTLVHEGVSVVFGYPGGAIMPAYDAMPAYPIRHVLVRHEQGAAHMADGYARASGGVGVCIATSGPGATNLVTGIANAMMDSIPMVCITGQVASYLIGSDGFQEVDFTGVTLPITKHNILVTRTEDIMPAIRQAFYIASSGRPGPVVVDITKDAQQGTVQHRYDSSPIRLPGYRPEHHPVPSEIEEAAAMIKAAKRPIIFCGHGIIEANATGLLLEFVQKTNFPVALTLLGLGGFPATHPLSLGMMGMHGEAWVNTAIQEADLIIAMGMRFDDRVTGNLKTYAQNAKKIHIELDPAEINKNVKVELPLVGDVREILRLLLPQVEKRTCDDWNAHINELKGDSAVREIQSLPDNGSLFAAHVIHDLWRYTQGKALVVTDVGQHQMWEAQYYKHDHPRKLLTSGGAGTMGFALPAAMGARMACPDDEIWVVVGDGGFQMTACELATCAQEDIKVNIAIINNGFLGMVRQWQTLFYNDRLSSVQLDAFPDAEKLAAAYGFKGRTVDKPWELAAALEEAVKEPGPYLLNVKVTPFECVYPMVPAGGALTEMVLGTPQPVAVPGK